MLIATLIAGDGLVEGDISTARDALAAIGAAPGAAEWLEPGIAVDLPFVKTSVAAARDALEGLLPRVDVVAQTRADRAKRLIVADMDSTMITIECIDELADYAGIKEEIAKVTEAAMRGELDFEGALKSRVRLLKGLEASAIDRCYEERVRLMPGARTLIQTMKAHGARTVLVSGGFTVFAERVAAAIGFDRSVSNVLGIDRDKLDGTVAEPIVGSATKKATLLEEMARANLPVETTLAIGDGANDIPMIEAAGLGVAFRAKPKTAAAANARLDYTDLSALLYVQGYPKAVWKD